MSFQYTPTVELACPSANGYRYTAAPAGGVTTKVAKSGRAFGYGLRAALSQGSPGNWASDHRGETDKFTGWHYIAISAAAKQAAQAECKVYQDGKDPKLASKRKTLRYKTKSAYGDDQAEATLPQDHPLVRLLKRPNPTQSGASFRYEYVMQLRLTGTCLIWNVSNKVGLPVERYIIPTAVAEPQGASNQYPYGAYRIDPSSARNWASYAVDQGFTEHRSWYRFVGKIVDARAVQVVRYPHPLYKDDGQSPVAASAIWTDTAEGIDKAQHGQMRQGANPSMMITMPEDVESSPAQLQADADRIKAKFGGPENTGAVIILTGGTEVNPVTTTPRDMAYEMSRPQYRDMLLAIHGVPAIAAGISEGGSYAAFVASLRQFIITSVQPDLDLLAEEDTEQLAPKFGKGLTIEYEATLIDDPQVLESQLATDVNAKARTINEHRAERGLPPVEWGNFPAGGDPSQAPQGPGGGFGGPPGVGGQPGGFGGKAPFGGKQGAGFGGLQGDPAAEGAGGFDKPTGGGEFMEKGQRVYRNASTRRDEILDKLTSGAYNPQRAVVELTMIGISEATAQKLVEAMVQADVEDDGADEALPPEGMTAKSIKRMVARAVAKTVAGMQTQAGADGGLLVKDEVAKARLQGPGSNVVSPALGLTAHNIVSQAVRPLDAQVDRAALSTETDPTPAQKETGDYAKGRVRIGPLDIYIENPRGSTRSGTAPDGKQWSQTMHAHYGFINRAGRSDIAPGKDGDAVDVFVGPDTDSEVVYVIDQINGQGGFDEHKVMVGYTNERAAVTGYLKNYEAGWEVGPVTAMTMRQFTDWLKTGDLTRPVADSLGPPRIASVAGGEVYQTPVGGLLVGPDELAALADLAKSYLAAEVG